MTDISCAGTRYVIQQRRQFSFFNTPLSRVSLVSPYPKVRTEENPGITPAQLDMRRKVEILKYSNNSSSSKTNNLTKRQKWALLAKGHLPQMSQYQIASLNSATVCLGDQYLPTSTTACGVPGPPMILQYDPKVPLYKYAPEIANRTYGTTLVSTTPNDVFKNYTINEMLFIQDTYLNLYGDFNPLDETIMAASIPTLQMTSPYSQIGTIQILYNMTAPTYSFNIECPMGFWVMGAKGQGIYDANACSEEIIDCPDSAIVKAPGDFDATDNVRVRMMSIRAEVRLNDTVVKTINISAMPMTTDQSNNQFIDVSFNADTDVTDLREFYGIQYVGMLNVSVPNLSTTPGDVYVIYGTATYNYTFAPVKKFDVFKTGVFFNLSDSIPLTKADDIRFQSVPPTNYSNGTNDFFDYGDPPVSYIVRKQA